MSAVNTGIGASAEAIAQSDAVIAGIGASATGFEVTDPATGAVLLTVADDGVPEALAAVDRAFEAGREWSRSTLRHRSDLLRRVYDAVMDRAEDFALLITREMGKPLAESRAEVEYAADFIRWYADEAVRPAGGYQLSPTGTSRLVTTRSPVGVCLLVTPWNFPLAMATRKIAPALAAGCTVILKPAALTPLASLLFVEVLRAAGLPEGVVNVVTTTNAGAISAAVMADHRVRKISFTGSTPVGMRLLEQGARNVLRASMELGGNAPFLVFDDANLERAVNGAMLAKLRNGGQSCIAANRFLVQEGIADDFVEAFTERMRAVTVGNGLDPVVTLGPVIDARAQNRLTALVEDAVNRGAHLLTGGQTLPGVGHFFEPTVLDAVPRGADALETEIFGPVAAISRFSSQEEGIALANDTPFGLSSYVYTQDLDRAFEIAERLESGMVGVNQGVVSNVAAPFGGIKHSGLGREGGAEGLEEYQDVRYIAIARGA